MSDNIKSRDQSRSDHKVSRRNVLKAAAAAGGAAVLGFPMIAKGQSGPITMRWQSTWPQKDIFHEYALDFAKKVNDMTGGDLKIEVLPAGAVVPAFQLIDAVSKGIDDSVPSHLASTDYSSQDEPTTESEQEAGQVDGVARQDSPSGIARTDEHEESVEAFGNEGAVS